MNAPYASRPEDSRNRSLSGKTLANVATRDRVDSSDIPYRWNHWHTTPSGLRRDATMRKYSCVKRLAIPVIQGFDGSEMMTSYSSGERRRRARASPSAPGTRGLCEKLPPRSNRDWTWTR